MIYDRDVPIDETFERTYTLEWLADLPNSPSFPRYYLPRGQESGGPILRVTNGIGQKYLVIVSGEIGGFRIATWPDPNRFLVRPGGWLFDATEPTKAEQLPGFDGHTVHYVVPLAERSLVLVGHCCGIYCYDGEGMRWQQEDLFCCDDPQLEVAGDVLLLTAQKHGVDPENTPTLKRLDLMTGTPLT